VCDRLVGRPCVRRSDLRAAQLEVGLGQLLRHPNLVATLAHGAVQLADQGARPHWAHPQAGAGRSGPCRGAPGGDGGSGTWASWDFAGLRDFVPMGEVVPGQGAGEGAGSGSGCGPAAAQWPSWRGRGRHTGGRCGAGAGLPSGDESDRDACLAGGWVQRQEGRPTET
jgi:hypothetical protein